MPYIKQEDRPQYDAAIACIVNKLLALEENDVKGHLNFIFFSIITKYLAVKGIRYFRLNDLVGVFECCKLELYRRVIGPYEDSAITKNGDIKG